MWQYKEEFSPFSLVGVWLNIRMDIKNRNLFPELFTSATEDSWFAISPGYVQNQGLRYNFPRNRSSYLPSYSQLFIDSFKQQVFIENCAVGRYSVLWRYVGGQDKQGPCSWGSYVRQETETKTTKQTDEQDISNREKCHEENTAAKREGLMIMKGLYHLGEGPGKASLRR